MADPMVAAAAFLNLADDAMRMATPEQLAEARQVAVRVKDALEGVSDGQVGICALFVALVKFGEVILTTPPEGHSGAIN